MSSAISMLKIVIIFILVSEIRTHKDIQYIIEEELPEYSQYIKMFKNNLTHPFNNSTETIKNITKKNSGVLCAFSEETLKETPSLAIYCFILALAWLCLMCALCFKNIRQILERVLGLIHEFRSNRENNAVISTGEEILPRMHTIGSITSPV